MKNYRFILIGALLTLSACGMNDYVANSLARKDITITSSDNFPHCYGYGCEKKKSIHFSDKDWQPIKSLFTPASKTAEEERTRIKSAIAVFEQIAGKQAGTENDKAGTFRHIMADGLQQDCVDESINTTIYLSLLEHENLMLHHRVLSPTVRLPIIHAGRWPHQTAVIEDVSNTQKYAVDSWFHDNGEPSEIIKLEDWKNGWKPSRL